MSEALNVTKASFGGLREVATAPLWQWDYGQILKITGLDLPQAFEVHFSNSRKSGETITQIGTDSQVTIPDMYLTSGADIYAFIFLHDGLTDGETEYVIKIPVRERPEPSDIEPTPEQQDAITEAIAALNDAVEQTGEDKAATAALAEAAAASSLVATEAAQSAQGSATSASGSATAATNAASTATAKASAAATSAANAASAKTAAETAETNARAAQTASESAQASAQSAAQTATSKAAEASTSATSASGSASAASASATAASESATNAAASATAASGSATSAATSATTASTKASEAAQSEANTVIAKNAAEAAQTAAETAKTAAEAARDETVAEVATISGALNDKADVIISTAEGAIATFTDGGNNMPMVSCVAKIEPVQSGSGDPSPDNVRPISGWTGCNVVRAGKNLFPYKDIESQTKNGVTFTVEKSNGVITNIHMQGTATAQFPIPFYVNGVDEPWVLPKGDFKLYIGGDKPTQRRIFDLNVRKIGTTSDIVAGSNVITITLSERTTFGSAYIWIYSGAVLNHNIIPVIVQSGVDTSVKYPITQRQSITIDLDQTVYGGTLDVVSGVLTVTHGEIDSYAGETLPSAWISDRDVYAEGTTPTTGAQVVYELATPQTYQLTPVEVKTLLGLNNVWADTGDTEVEYRADTKLYIKRLTAPDSEDMIADANITSGQYFMVGNSLYLATANIANGASIIVGTNCTRKSLSEALNEINS